MDDGVAFDWDEDRWRCRLLHAEATSDHGPIVIEPICDSESEYVGLHPEECYCQNNDNNCADA